MARTKGGTEFDPAALERAELRFRGRIWDAAPRAVAVAKGVRRAELGPVQATVVAALPEARPLNLILGGASADAAAEGFLAEAIEWCRGQAARCYVPLAPDQPGTASAQAALAAARFERVEGRMRFVRDAHPPRFEAPADVEVVEVDDSGACEPFGAIAALGLGLPPWVASLFAPLPALPGWRCYLARVDGTARACAAMLLDGELARLGLAVTLEAGPRHGCRAALLRRSIEDAAAAGARALCAEAGEHVPGRPRADYGDLLRAGFEEAYLSPGWIDARPPAG